jgi:hypothetical protein
MQLWLLRLLLLVLVLLVLLLLLLDTLTRGARLLLELWPADSRAAAAALAALELLPSPVRIRVLDTYFISGRSRGPEAAEHADRA